MKKLHENGPDTRNSGRSRADYFVRLRNYSKKLCEDGFALNREKRGDINSSQNLRAGPD